MKVYQALWEQLIDYLDQAGWLSVQAGKSTPAEIAIQVARQTRDMRVHKFVWNYYYPLAFGNQAGTMTDQEAKALVESLHQINPNERIRAEGRRAETTAIQLPRSVPTCQVCGVRPVTPEGPR